MATPAVLAVAEDDVAVDYLPEYLALVGGEESCYQV